MDNQQERSLSWLAGILDGEGSISVQVYTMPDGRVRLTPFVAIANTDEGILSECCRIFAELGIIYRNCAKPLTEGEFKGKLPCRQLRVDGQKPVETLLRAVGPYLRSAKAKYAENVLKYLESRKANGFQRDEKGRVRRCEYTRAEIDLISSVRTGKRSKSSEAICQAPNVLG